VLRLSPEPGRRRRRLALAIALAIAVPGLAWADGAALYAQHCAACHQPGGEGVPSLYPRLSNRLGRYLGLEGGRAYLIRVPAFGMSGPIPEDGIVAAFMPPLPQLGDAQLADVLNHALTGLPQERRPANDAPFTADEVAAARATTLSPTEVHRERQRLVAALEGTGARSTPAAPSGAAQASGRAPMPVISGAMEDYSRNCQGCHLGDGRGIPGLVPNMANFVGYFTHLPEGRAFLVRVPGVAQAPLDDARLAAVLNWMLLAFSRDQLPADFQPYTADEVKRHRAGVLTAVTAERQALIDRLKAHGIVK
jgi:mono/diheme cytochrome c family protein